MNYTCFFCGRATRENGEICEMHKRKLDAPHGEVLRTRVGQARKHPRTIVQPPLDNGAERR